MDDSVDMEDAFLYQEEASHLELLKDESPESQLKNVLKVLKKMLKYQIKIIPEGPLKTQLPQVLQLTNYIDTDNFNEESLEQQQKKTLIAIKFLEKVLDVHMDSHVLQFIPVLILLKRELGDLDTNLLSHLVMGSRRSNANNESSHEQKIVSIKNEKEEEKEFEESNKNINSRDIIESDRYEGFEHDSEMQMKRAKSEGSNNIQGEQSREYYNRNYETQRETGVNHINRMNTNYHIEVEGKGNYERDFAYHESQYTNEEPYQQYEGRYENYEGSNANRKRSVEFRDSVNYDNKKFEESYNCKREAHTLNKISTTGTCYNSYEAKIEEKSYSNNDAKIFKINNSVGLGETVDNFQNKGRENISQFSTADLDKVKSKGWSDTVQDSPSESDSENGDQIGNDHGNQVEEELVNKIEKDLDEPIEKPLLLTNSKQNKSKGLQIYLILQQLKSELESLMDSESDLFLKIQLAKAVKTLHSEEFMSTTLTAKQNSDLLETLFSLQRVVNMSTNSPSEELIENIELLKKLCNPLLSYDIEDQDTKIGNSQSPEESSFPECAKTSKSNGSSFFDINPYSSFFKNQQLTTSDEHSDDFYCKPSASSINDMREHSESSTRNNSFQPLEPPALPDIILTSILPPPKLSIKDNTHRLQPVNEIAGYQQQTNKSTEHSLLNLRGREDSHDKVPQDPRLRKSNKPTQLWQNDHESQIRDRHEKSSEFSKENRLKQLDEGTFQATKKSPHDPRVRNKFYQTTQPATEIQPSSSKSSQIQQPRPVEKPVVEPQISLQAQAPLLVTQLLDQIQKVTQLIQSQQQLSTSSTSSKRKK